MSLPAPGRTNRIEVDLKLLQDSNLEKLREFGKQFDNSVKSLGIMLGEYAEQISGAANLTQGVGKPGPDASVADTGTLGTRLGGTSQVFGDADSFTFPEVPQFLNGGPLRGARRGGDDGGGGAEPPTGQPSIAGTPSGEPPGTPSSRFNPDESAFEHQFIRAQRRIGEIPVGMRQTFGYMAEGQLPFLQKPEYMTDSSGGVLKDRQGEPIPLMNTEGQKVPAGFVMDEDGNISRGKAMRIGEKASDYLFTTQAVRANFNLMGSHLSNIRSGIFGNTQSGMDLGYGKTGDSFFGIPGLGKLTHLGGLGGPAMTESLRQNFEGMKQSWFGLNPNFSSEQASTIRNMLQSYGYSGDKNFDWVGDRLKDLWIDKNIQPDVSMQLMDPYIRFGGSENFQQLEEVLRGIPDAAKAAKMNLQEFSKELVSTASSIAQSTGMTPTAATGALTAFSTVTGLNPQRAEGLMSNPRNYMVASAMSGQSIWELTNGHNKMAALQSFGMMQFKNTVGGMTPTQIMKGLKQPKNSSEYKNADAMMSRAQMLYMNNPEIFGGLTPREILNEATRAGGYDKVLSRESVIERLSSIDTTKSVNFQQLITQFGGDAKHKADTENKLDDFMESYDKDHTSAAVAEIAEMKNPVQQRAALAQIQDAKLRKKVADGLKDRAQHIHTMSSVERSKFEKTERNEISQRREAERTELIKLFSDRSRESGEKAAQKMTVGLTGETRRYFQLLDNTYGSGNKSHSNTWHSAGAFARGAMDVANSGLTHIVPGAGLAEKGAKSLLNHIPHNPF